MPKTRLSATNAKAAVKACVNVAKFSQFFTVADIVDEMLSDRLLGHGTRATGTKIIRASIEPVIRRKIFHIINLARKSHKLYLVPVTAEFERLGFDRAYPSHLNEATALACVAPSYHSCAAIAVAKRPDPFYTVDLMRDIERSLKRSISFYTHWARPEWTPEEERQRIEDKTLAFHAWATSFYDGYNRMFIPNANRKPPPLEPAR